MGDKSLDISTTVFSLYIAELIEYGIINEDEWKRFINEEDDE